FASIIRSATLLTRSWLILRLGTTRPLPIRPARAERLASAATRLERRDVLIPAQHVAGVVTALERPEAVERLRAERGPHPLQRLVRLHVVGVPAADRPRLYRSRGLAGPGDVLLVEGGVQPARHRADVEGGIPVAERRGGWIHVPRGAAQGLDKDRAWRAAERRQAVEERVDQLVRELADEVALPVVAVHPVTRVEDALLVEEGMGAHPVAREPARRAQPAEL